LSQLPLFERASPKKPRAKPTPEELDALAKVRLSRNFILRDFLFSTEAASLGLSNYPENPELVIHSGKALCEKVLEPILDHFGQFAITFGYQNREGIEYRWSKQRKLENSRSSSPHNWDRLSFGDKVYARVDIWPFCVEDGEVSKQEFGHWLMHNLDIDLLMQWKRANIFCITISPKPRRVWLEWGNPKLGEPKQETFMGTHYWQHIYPGLPENERPRFAPSCTGGRMQWR
jgi:hypothetical protein